jgi:transcriptional regulator with XRE-family HTH domain
LGISLFCRLLLVRRVTWGINLAMPSEDYKSDLRIEAGVWLRSMREARGLSQREFSDRMGAVYHTFISQIEAGRGRIPSERYETWARALEVDPRKFAITMLSFYEPATYELIFGKKEPPLLGRGLGRGAKRSLPYRVDVIRSAQDLRKRA